MTQSFMKAVTNNWINWESRGFGTDDQSDAHHKTWSGCEDTTMEAVTLPLSNKTLPLLILHGQSISLDLKCSH